MLQKVIPRKYHRKVYELKQRILGLYYIKSYSQEGEDLILNRLFENVKEGFYVDIGAHHPFRFSNTYLFYKKGWKGLNIDAMPGSMNLFFSKRNRDINLEVAISKSPQTLTYYSFEEPAINGFDSVLSESRIKAGEKLIKTIAIQSQRLDKILDQYLPDKMPIDFMSIDVEGLDLEILESNNWDKYKPKAIVIECLGADFLGIQKTIVYEYLIAKGYFLIAKTVNSCIFSQKNDKVDV